MGFWKFVLGFRFCISHTQLSFGFLIDSPSEIQSPILALCWWIPLFSSFHFSKLHFLFYINLRDLERVMILVSLREFAICKFVSFFHSCKTWVAMCMSPLFPSKQDNLTFWTLLFANLSAFSFLQTWRFACASLLVLTHSHPFLWVPQKMWSHPDNCACCCELAQAFLCLPPIHKDQNTPKKNSSQNQSSAKSLEVVSYKLSSRSARRLAKNKRPHDMSWTLT